MLDQDLVPSNKNLQPLTPELFSQVILSTSHTGPVSIIGVAKGRVPNTDIRAYFVVYKVVKKMGRFQINQELYSVFQTIFGMIKEENMDVINEWIARGDAP